MHLNGGFTSPAAFSCPDAVVHLDHVFLSELQPRVTVARLDLVVEGENLPLVRDGQYVIRF